MQQDRLYARCKYNGGPTATKQKNVYHRPTHSLQKWCTYPVQLVYRFGVKLVTSRECRQLTRSRPIVSV